MESENISDEDEDGEELSDVDSNSANADRRHSDSERSESSEVTSLSDETHELPLGRYQNLMNEFTDVDTFVISMDSLLIEIMLHDYLSWILGGQSLVVVYMIESFLKSLDDKGGRFQLVWFDDLECCFQSNSTALLMREIVKKHFNSIPSKENTFTFRSPFTLQWNNYVKQLSPSFMFCSNGNVNQQLFPGFDCSAYKECMTSLIIGCWNLNVATVSFDGIQQSAATFFAYRSEPIKIHPGAFVAARATWEGLQNTVSSNSHNGQSIENLKDFWLAVVKQFTEINKNGQKIYENYCNTFLQAFEVQTTVPLELRSQSLHQVELLPEAAVKFSKELYFVAARILHCLPEPLPFPVYDLIDGRFFAFFLTVDQQTIFNPSSSAKPPVVNSSLYQMRPLEHELFKLYATDIAKAINTSLSATDQSKRLVENESLFSELRHWHSGKFIEEDYKGKVKEESKSDWLKSKPEWLQKRIKMKENRNKQNLSKWYDFYGESLEGRKQSIFFHPPPKQDIIKKKPSKPHIIPNKSKSVIAKPLTKAEKIIQENTEKKLKEKVKEEIETVETAVRNSWQIPFMTKFVTAEGKATSLYHQALLLKKKVLDNREQDIEKRRTISVDLFLKLDHLLNRNFGGKKFVEFLNKPDQNIIQQIWQDLGFGKGESGKVNKTNTNLQLDMDVIDYRLAHAGESIEIQSDPVPDRRVEGFFPDGWQRELLDAVDNSQSALIIAPTSAGKTFISYYCIEKVLLETNNGIVVYVCPTKALVNQVAATVNARFKHINLEAGQALFGVFIRDYRKDVLNCRVLVTVPQSLETLLLSPQRQSWRQSLKYAIFDEVHCIGGGVGDILGSEVWEHIILLVPCPFLALSATVGNVQVLHNWLSQAEQLKMNSGAQDARQVILVEYNERYSELELSLFNIFDSKSSEHQLFELNPLSVCTTDRIREFGLPADQQLTARQIYNLWQAIKSVKIDVGANLKPSLFFGSNDSFLRRDLRDYETTLKQQFALLVKEGPEKEEGKFANDLFGNVDLQLYKRSITFNGKELAKNGVVDLILCLHKQKMLPCLCFSDDRSLCEAFAEKVLKHFVNEEMEFRKQNSKQERTKQKEAKHMEKFLKRQRDKEDKKKGDTKLDEKPDVQEETSLCRNEDLTYAKFKLAKPGLDHVLYQKVTDRLKKRDGDLESTEFLLNCIERGIGFHHAGMTTAQRQSVEILFRTGHLQILFTTATLALGIHMPCKTVVLAIDSPYLTPLQYRQMIGRAGRRGFDKSGNVILYSIPTKKISRLLTAALPNLRANLPFTVSYILRILAFIDSLPDSDKASSMKQICAMLQQPFIVHTLAQQREALQKQLEHYFVFGCHFLNRIHLINPMMKPIGAAGIVSHLSYHEPGNFIFTYFLQRGAFHALCHQFSGPDLDDILVLILSHLFTDTIVLDAKKYQDVTDGHRISKVILDELPVKFATLLNTYNEEVCKFYYSFLKSLADKLFPFDLNTNSSTQLPYSGTIIQSPNYLVKNDSNDSVLHILTASKVTDTKIGGPIFSITGKNDFQLNLVNLNLVYPLRQGIYYDQGFVPAGLQLQKNHRGESIARNAYALDFWKHESNKAIISENHIFEGDAFHLLNDFRLVLKAIRFSFEELGPAGDIVVSTFAKLSEAYDEKFGRVFYSSKQQ